MKQTYQLRHIYRELRARREAKTCFNPFTTSISLSNKDTSNPSTVFTGAWNFQRSSNSTEN